MQIEYFDTKFNFPLSLDFDIDMDLERYEYF